jgi:hypothetical protein
MRILGVVMTLILCAAIAYAAGRPIDTTANAVEQAVESPAPNLTPSKNAPSNPLPAPEQPALEAAIAALESEYQVSLGVGLAALSAGEAAMNAWTGGSISTGPAWATIDIPVALAVMAEPKQPNDLNYLLERAIVESSNAGGDALWQFLGDNEQAATKTEDVLRASGDLTTAVARVSDASTTPLAAQTRWTLGNQSAFAGWLYCSDQAFPLLLKMSERPATGGFGLATLPRTQVKSGWGAEPNGTVSVRQLGVVLLSDGSRVGVSMIAVAGDGSLATAQAALTELATRIAASATGFPETCS